MIGYVMLGTRDLDKAAAYYDELLAVLGHKRLMEFDASIAWGDPKGAALAVGRPFDGAEPTVGNGVMVALQAADTATVDKVYAKALELGGACEGPADPRGDGFYAGYFRDLDGNKLNCFCFTEG